MRLRTLLAILLLAAAPCSAGEDVHDDLRRIMAKPEYRRWRLDRPEKTEERSSSWLMRVWEWIDYFAKKDDESADPQPAPRTKPRSNDDRLFTVMMYGMLALTAVFLLAVLYSLWRQRRRRRPPPEAAPVAGMARALTDGDALAYAGTEWLAEGERLQAAGDSRLAFRSLYLGLLAELHAEGRIAFVPNRSNWHYVAAYRGEDREEFAAVTALFDRVWYGHEDTAAAEGVARLRSRALTLEANHG